MGLSPLCPMVGVTKWQFSLWSILKSCFYSRVDQHGVWISSVGLNEHNLEILYRFHSNGHKYCSCSCSRSVITPVVTGVLLHVVMPARWAAYLWWDKASPVHRSRLTSHSHDRLYFGAYHATKTEVSPTPSFRQKWPRHSVAVSSARPSVQVEWRVYVADACRAWLSWW